MNVYISFLLITNKQIFWTYSQSQILKFSYKDIILIFEIILVHLQFT